MNILLLLLFQTVQSQTALRVTQARAPIVRPIITTILQATNAQVSPASPQRSTISVTMCKIKLLGSFFMMLRLSADKQYKPV